MIPPTANTNYNKQLNAYPNMMSSNWHRFLRYRFTQRVKRAAHEYAIPINKIGTTERSETALWCQIIHLSF
jgi:hypothetical protein